MTSSKGQEGARVHKSRWRELRRGAADKSGPVVYLCERDQRVRDNWALLHAVDEAERSQKPVVVVFVVTPADLALGERHSLFMIKGLEEMQESLAPLNIPFHLARGEPTDVVPKLLESWDASVLVTDFSPLRVPREWREALADAIEIPFHEVDAHNVIPVWITSNKQEYAARTIRNKIHRNIPKYLRPIPKLSPLDSDWSSTSSFSSPEKIDWDALMQEARKAADPGVHEVTWCSPGEKAAHAALKGEDESFLTKRRMNKYDELRNNPNIPAGECPHSQSFPVLPCQPQSLTPSALCVLSVSCSSEQSEPVPSLRPALRAAVRHRSHLLQEAEPLGCQERRQLLGRARGEERALGQLLLLQRTLRFRQR